MKTRHRDPGIKCWRLKCLAKGFCSISVMDDTPLDWANILSRWHGTVSIVNNKRWNLQYSRRMSFKGFVSFFFLRRLGLFWHSRKVLHASQLPLLWQLHLMSAKWSEKHPLPRVASWWQGRGAAVIRALESCTHLGRWDACPSGRYQVAQRTASKPNKTLSPTSHETFSSNSGVRTRLAPSGCSAKGSFKVKFF